MVCLARQNVSRKMDGEDFRRAGAEHVRLNRDHSRIDRAVELPLQTSFPEFELSKFEGSLARKLCFHIFNSCVPSKKKNHMTVDSQSLHHHSYVYAGKQSVFSGKSQLGSNGTCPRARCISSISF